MAVAAATFFLFDDGFFDDEEADDDDDGMMGRYGCVWDFEKYRSVWCCHTTTVIYLFVCFVVGMISRIIPKTTSDRTWNGNGVEEERKRGKRDLVLCGFPFGST